MNIATLDKTQFKPGSHSFTVYAVEGNPAAVYIESDTHGDEKAIRYTFTPECEIEDTEGSFCPSDAFDVAVIALVKSTCV